jgi:hypothetical protein
MSDASPTREERFTGNWMWLFPVAYLFHILEEHWADFNGWVAELWQVESSDAYFLIWNFMALLGMTVSVCLVLKTKSWRWLILGFGWSVLGNGLLHLWASIRNPTYTPGVLTSLVCWLPLGVYTIWRARATKMNARARVAGVIFGIVANIVILLFVFIVPRLFSK